MIPVVDLAGSEGEVCRELDRACREVGFFTVRGHGIARPIIDDAFSACRDFFSLPASEKQKHRLQDFTLPADQYTPYGYSGLLEENAFAYMGRPGMPADYVEKMSAGRLILDDREPLPLGGELRQWLRRYFVACKELSSRLTELFAVALGRPRDFFASRIGSSNDSLRAHRYPAHSHELANRQGMGTHTDGTLISLLTHTAPGIEVRMAGGEWVTPHFYGTDHFLVNIGDLMAHWTGGQYASTEHRVTIGAQERHSIVFFKLTDDDMMVELGNRQMDALFGRADGSPRICK